MCVCVCECVNARVCEYVGVGMDVYVCMLCYRYVSKYARNSVCMIV